MQRPFPPISPSYSDLCTSLRSLSAHGHEKANLIWGQVSRPSVSFPRRFPLKILLWTPAISQPYQKRQLFRIFQSGFTLISRASWLFAILRLVISGKFDFLFFSHWLLLVTLSVSTVNTKNHRTQSLLTVVPASLDDLRSRNKSSHSINIDCVPTTY